MWYTSWWQVGAREAQADMEETDSEWLMCAASQLPGWGPTDVDVAPAC